MVVDPLEALVRDGLAGDIGLVALKDVADELEAAADERLGERVQTALLRMGAVVTRPLLASLDGLGLAAQEVATEGLAGRAAAAAAVLRAICRGRRRNAPPASP